MPHCAPSVTPKGCTHVKYGVGAAANIMTGMQELLDFEFDHKYMMRGLIIDKKRGNVLKMDRHKYVKIAFHGFKKLSREERLATYALQRVSLSPHLSAVVFQKPADVHSC